MLDGAEGEEKAQGFAKSVIRSQTLHLTCVESLAWCSSLFLGGLVESWAHWAQGSEDERSQHCASFAGHGGDLQVASVFPQKL